jgi:hypothetical protein
MAGWRAAHAITVKAHLDEAPENEREQLAGVLACAKLLDPQLVVRMIDNVNGMKPEERAEIYRLSESGDPRERLLALSKADRKPPQPDPRLNIIGTAIKLLPAAADPYPDDPLTPEIRDVIGVLKDIRRRVSAVSFDARREMTQGVFLQ